MSMARGHLPVTEAVAAFRASVDLREEQWRAPFYGVVLSRHAAAASSS